MKEIYSKIWELAKEYYLRGRAMDIDHVQWMMEDAMKVCKKEGIDDTLLLPLVILHDVGYAEVPKGNPFKLDLRKAHMEAGAKIAKKILKQVNYPKGKIEKIGYYVSVHDNWAFGVVDVYLKDIVLNVFNDLDFIWMYTPKGFPAMMTVMNKTSEDLLQWLESQPSPSEGKKPFSTKTTKDLYDGYLAARQKEFRKQ
jgi:hypothetical protein